MRRLLCLIGLHKWITTVRLYGQPAMRRCSRCGKVDVLDIPKPRDQKESCNGGSCSLY